MLTYQVTCKVTEASGPVWGIETGLIAGGNSLLHKPPCIREGPGQSMTVVYRIEATRISSIPSPKITVITQCLRVRVIPPYLNAMITFQFAHSSQPEPESSKVPDLNGVGIGT